MDLFSVFNDEKADSDNEVEASVASEDAQKSDMEKETETEIDQTHNSGIGLVDEIVESSDEEQKYEAQQENLSASSDKVPNVANLEVETPKSASKPTNSISEKSKKITPLESPEPSVNDSEQRVQAHQNLLKSRTAHHTITDEFETEKQRELKGGHGGLLPSESEEIVVAHTVRHQVAVPLGHDYKSIAQHTVSQHAKEFPFELDPFQAVAVACIDRGESVMVSAHTSAGKTVVAEYAIAQCLRDRQRIIYTSPIKALSNQKYRDFKEVFGDVGLMTGDVTLNPDASCLVMTTEILRSMLYKGSHVVREAGWIVFDEVHYMRDPNRGVVWEETIILLPDNVRYVFLSATIPNALQFAEWICRIHSQPCHVVYTNFRPTPLQHYLFPAGGDGIYLVMDEKGNFRQSNFDKAIKSVSLKEQDPPPEKKQKKDKVVKKCKIISPSLDY